MDSRIKALKLALSHCMLKDQFLLAPRLSAKNIGSLKQLESLERSIEKSRTQVDNRRRSVPTITYDPALPIADKREEIKALIRDNQVVVLSGETGSGKTTQIPKICLELGLGCKGMIGHTQPRRIAARTVANRIAEELQTSIGQSVGYKVRFHDHVSENSHIKLMTDGILLAETQTDRHLLAYEVIIIDEAHERSLNIDFLLGYLKTILSKRPNLKLIVTSATIDTEKFSKHFSGAPIIEVSGRTYPVELRYQPVEEADDEPALPKAISDAVFELMRIQPGDTLVFLPGEREIREVAEYLRKHHPPHTEILPLYARLSVADQEAIFRSHRGQRVVLATNVAETSLTVPGIRYVVDSGLARVSRYSVRNRIQRLPIEVISQAAANQRAGRCGRVAAGICVRLYSEEDFLGRPAFTDPEILRINLASAILKMISLKIGDISQFPFIQPPEKKFINDGKKLLFELGALDADDNLAPLGAKLAQLPVDPRMGKMLLAAGDEGCVREVLIITAFLSVQDPRERPYDAQQKASQAHSRFVDSTSDFLGILKLWDYYQDRAKHLTQNKFRKLCKQEFLSYMRLREWKDIYTQIKNQLDVLKLKLNSEPAHYDAIHRAILSGLLSNIGNKQEDAFFVGCKQTKFYVVPGSGQYAKPAKWVVASEIVETRRNFARNVAKIKPEWVVDLADHLLTRSYFEPHWQKSAGQVAAYVRISLYGLILVGKQRVNYGPINPAEAREVFIQQALVAENLQTNEAFYQHNQLLLEDIRKLENKSRRPDILVADHERYALYDQQIPQDIYSSKSFHQWIKQAKQNKPDILFFNTADLMREDARFNAAQFPDEISVAGYVFPVRYLFEPTEEQDGLTVIMSLELLNQVKAYWFDWLVPGLLHEKVVSLIKTLPKNIRKNYVPVPEVATDFIHASKPYEVDLHQALAEFLSHRGGITLDADDFDLERIANYLLPSIELRNEDNQCIAISKDLTALQLKYESQAQKAFSQRAVQHEVLENIQDWDFEIPEFVEMKSAQGGYRAYPALQVVDGNINLNYFPNPLLAEESMRQGLLALIKNKLGSELNALKRNLLDIDKQCLFYQKTASCQELKDEMIDFILRFSFELEHILPKSYVVFQQQFETNKTKLQENAKKICQLNYSVLDEFYGLQKQLKAMKNPQLLESLSDITDQLKGLVFRHYLQTVTFDSLQHYPRYLKAISRRLDKVNEDPLNDRKKMLQIKPYWQKYKALSETSKKTPAAEELRWMIEEYRVSLYAQNLKTSAPISDKRLRAQWEKI